jgi:hypothetical protein
MRKSKATCRRILQHLGSSPARTQDHRDLLVLLGHLVLLVLLGHLVLLVHLGLLGGLGRKDLEALHR